MGPNLDQNRTEFVSKWNQTGTKLKPKWDQTGIKINTKMKPKWDQTGAQLWPDTGQHQDPKKCRKYAVVIENRVATEVPAWCGT